MHTKIYLLFLTAACGIFWGCHPHQKAIKRHTATLESKALHFQAREALDRGEFIIEAREFYSKEARQMPAYSTQSFLTMTNNRVTIRYETKVVSRYIWDWTINEYDAEIIRENMQRNGDVHYHLKLTNITSGGYFVISVTLYKGTNRCLVEHPNNSFSYYGFVFPYTD